MRATTITATGAGRRDCARRGADRPTLDQRTQQPRHDQAGFFVVRPPRRRRGRRRY